MNNAHDEPYETRTLGTADSASVDNPTLSWAIWGYPPDSEPLKRCEKAMRGSNLENIVLHRDEYLSANTPDNRLTAHGFQGRTNFHLIIAGLPGTLEQSEELLVTLRNEMS